jgi:solute carrier family 35 protein E1
VAYAYDAPAPQAQHYPIAESFDGPVFGHYTVPEHPTYPVQQISSGSGLEDAATFLTGISAAPVFVALAVYGFGRSFSKSQRRVGDIEMSASEAEEVAEGPQCVTVLEDEACEVDPAPFITPAPRTEKQAALIDMLKTGFYFTAWYFFNTAYNIYNKKALNAIALPWTAATIHLATGIPYVLFLWTTQLRTPPSVSVDNVKNLSGVIAGHLGTHVGGVVASGAGAVSFMQIVKASEPVVSCILSAVILGQVFSPWVYLTLVPIVGGVALASLTELSFTWLAFGSAMVSNVSSAMRAILAKKAMSKPQGKNMTEANLYGVLTIACFCLLLPVSLLVETPAKIARTWAAANAAGISSGYIVFNLFMSGACYYLYNETAFLALGRVNAVTHAIASTVKRIFIIVATVIVFRTTLSPLGVIGSGIAVVGAFLYAIAKQKAPKPAPAA